MVDYKKHLIKTALFVMMVSFVQIVAAQIKAGEATVTEGNTTTIYLATTYQNTLRKSKVISYSWSSDKSAYVSVVSSTQNYATIKGVKPISSCKVYFKCSYSLDGFYRTMNFYYDVEVKAASVKVTNVVLSHSTATMTVGDKLQLTASVYPTNATNRGVNWSTSYDRVASVNSYGTVTANSAGTATITCMAADGSGCKATCLITVVDAGTKDLVITDKEGLTDIPEVANVSYERTFYEGWTSVCLPFAFDAEILGLQDAKIVRLTEIKTIGSKQYVAYDTVEYVDAGTPCLIYVSTEQTSKVDLQDAPLVDKPDNSGLLQGTFVETVIGADCYKLTTDGNSFATTKNSSSVCKPFRGYIKL